MKIIGILLCVPLKPIRNLMLFPALRKFGQVAIWETNQNYKFLLFPPAAYRVLKAMKFIMVTSFTRVL